MDSPPSQANPPGRTPSALYCDNALHRGGALNLDRDLPGACRRFDDRRSPLEQLGVDRAEGLVDEATHRRFHQAFEQPLERGPWIAARFSADAAAEPSSQWTTVTSPTRSSSVPGRSGSASAGSIPAASIAARPASRRLVPRTAQPSASRSSPSCRPRQPQPTISARATCVYVASEPRRCRSRSSSSAATSSRSSCSLRSAAPRRRRISFCASSICCTSSISFCASTSGERVGFQSTVGVCPGRSARRRAARR